MVMVSVDDRRMHADSPQVGFCDLSIEGQLMLSLYSSNEFDLELRFCVPLNTNRCFGDVLSRQSLS